METSPVPSPAAMTEPRGCHLCRVRAGVRRILQRCYVPSACRPRVLGGRWDPWLSRRSSWSQGKGETGRLRAGRLPAARPAGEEPGTGERGHWQCKAAPDGDLSVCLSVIGLGAGP